MQEPFFFEIRTILPATLFLGFFEQVIVDVLKSSRIRGSPIPSMISQVILRLSSPGQTTNYALTEFAPFLARMLSRVPDLSSNESTSVEEIRGFITEFSGEIEREMTKFSDQKLDEPILISSFAQDSVPDQTSNSKLGSRSTYGANSKLSFNYNK
jgi:hypothetical protein